MSEGHIRDGRNGTRATSAHGAVCKYGLWDARVPNMACERRTKAEITYRKPHFQHNLYQECSWVRGSRYSSLPWTPVASTAKSNGNTYIAGTNCTEMGCWALDFVAYLISAMHISSACTLSQCWGIYSKRVG
eukprot:1416640-Rhodomonas_salina.1